MLHNQQDCCCWCPDRDVGTPACLTFWDWRAHLSNGATSAILHHNISRHQLQEVFQQAKGCDWTAGQAPGELHASSFAGSDLLCAALALARWAWHGMATSAARLRGTGSWRTATGACCRQCTDHRAWAPYLMLMVAAASIEMPDGTRQRSSSLNTAFCLQVPMHALSGTARSQLLHPSCSLPGSTLIAWTSPDHRDCLHHLHIGARPVALAETPCRHPHSPQSWAKKAAEDTPPVSG